MLLVKNRTINVFTTSLVNSSNQSPNQSFIQVKPFSNTKIILFS